MTPLVLYQTVHLQALEPRFVRQHIALLDHSSRKLFGRPYKADADVLGRRIRDVALRAGYPAAYSSFVRVELSEEGERLVAAGVSLYDGYVLRYVKPEAVTLTCGVPLSYAPTTARAAIQSLADLYARPKGGRMSVCCDTAGRMIMADNAPLFGIRTKEMFVGAALPSVERSLVVAMADALQLPCSKIPLTSDMVSRLDELFYVDHRGVTAFSSCDGHPLMSLRAERIAKAMEMQFHKS